MQSIDLIRNNLKSSRDLVLRRIEEMQEHSMVAPTVNGGPHTLWVLGHLAFIEGQVTRTFMLGEENPYAHLEDPFDVDEVSYEASKYPPFDQVLALCRESREATLRLIDSLNEEDLDKISVKCPQGVEATFGTYRQCLQFMADHWYMHRGQLADARRSSEKKRMWF